MKIITLLRMLVLSLAQRLRAIALARRAGLLKEIKHPVNPDSQPCPFAASSFTATAWLTSSGAGWYRVTRRSTCLSSNRKLMMCSNRYVVLDLGKGA